MKTAIQRSVSDRCPFLHHGAGSVVTRDVPPYVFAAGNPCRVIRELNDRDKEYYFRDMQADQVEW